MFLLFHLIVFFFIIYFQTFKCTKKHHVYNLYRLSYTLRFCYLVYSIMSEIYIGGSFLKDCLYCYFQQVISAVTNEYLIPYNFIKRAPETQNHYCNTECQPKPIQKVGKYSLDFRRKDFFCTNINSKNMCIIVCKIQCLKNFL